MNDEPRALTSAVYEYFVASCLASVKWIAFVRQLATGTHKQPGQYRPNRKDALIGKEASAILIGPLKVSTNRNLWDALLVSKFPSASQNRLNRRNPDDRQSPLAGSVLVGEWPAVGPGFRKKDPPGSENGGGDRELQAAPGVLRTIGPGSLTNSSQARAALAA